VVPTDPLLLPTEFIQGWSGRVTSAVLVSTAGGAQYSIGDELAGLGNGEFTILSYRQHLTLTADRIDLNKRVLDQKSARFHYRPWRRHVKIRPPHFVETVEVREVCQKDLRLHESRPLPAASKVRLRLFKI
jgi:hypothetical protein